jgi:hypothetical protein
MKVNFDTWNNGLNSVTGQTADTEEFDAHFPERLQHMDRELDEMGVDRTGWMDFSMMTTSALWEFIKQNHLETDIRGAEMVDMEAVINMMAAGIRCGLLVGLKVGIAKKMEDDLLG